MQPLIAELAELLDGDSVAAPRAAQLYDSTEVRGIAARADAWVTPGSTQEVARVLAWCNEHDVAVTARGGGTGFAGGAVPLEGGVLLSLERMTRVRALEPLRWRMCVEAGLTTAHVRRLARENGLLFPPDPGAGEQSQIGGNIATNAGGPHAFKYGVTGAWVSGLEAVLADGEVITLGGAITKDVAGYDLRSLLIGSEGTLAIITAASRRCRSWRSTGSSRPVRPRSSASSAAVSPSPRSSTWTRRRCRSRPTGFRRSCRAVADSW
jgi:FAD/FMN-containing dehydrogenase